MIHLVMVRGLFFVGWLFIVPLTVIKNSFSFFRMLKDCGYFPAYCAFLNLINLNSPFIFACDTLTNPSTYFQKNLLKQLTRLL